MLQKVSIYPFKYFGYHNKISKFTGSLNREGAGDQSGKMKAALGAFVHLLDQEMV